MEKSKYVIDYDDILGSGSYGTVFKGKYKCDETSLVAIKKIKEDGNILTDTAKRELLALSKVTGHKNMLALLDVIVDKLNVYFVTEYCEEGDLEKYLKSNNLEMNKKFQIMHECAAGLNFLHCLNPPMIHRDIKLGNILLKRLLHGVVVKIADFGMAKDLEKGGQMTLEVGTAMYRAPELFNQDNRLYSSAIDVFAIGLVFDVILKSDKDKPATLEPGRQDGPYLHYGHKLLYNDANNLPVPALYELRSTDSLPEVAIKSIITKMTHLKSECRPTMQEVHMDIEEIRDENEQNIRLSRTQRVRQLMDMNRQLESRDRELSQIFTQLNNKDKLLSDQQSENNSLQKELGKKDRHLSQTLSQLAQKDKVLAIQQIKINELQTQLRKQQRHLAEVEGQLASKHEELADKGKLLCEKDQLLSEAMDKINILQENYDSLELPPTWANMKKNQPFGLYDLTAGSAEYKQIAPIFSTSFQKGGSGYNSITKVGSALDKTCNDETQDKILDSKDDQEIIKKLTAQQVKNIQHLEKTNYVKIKIDRGYRLCRIRIQGQHQNVLNVMEKIYQIFREVEQAEREKSEAEYIAAQVQWQYADGSTFQTYPPEMNKLIEKAYLKKESVVEFTELDDQGQPKVVSINFGTLEETEKGSSHAVKVRRYTSELPPTWANMKKNQPFGLYDLTAGSAEYKQIETTFSISFRKGGSGYNSIIKIQRLQNPSMYRRYQFHKNHMEAANPPGTTNERVLWHGPADDTLHEINANGFNRSFCGRNGTAFGRGVYFARYTTLASGYSKPNANGHKHMYMCRVLTGEFTTGNSSLRVPPPKDANKPNIKFDSVVDNITNTKIYVVFQDTHSYPEYLITFN